jgi:hypothetical protein
LHSTLTELGFEKKRTREWIATKGRPVLAWSNLEHYVVIGEHGRHGQDAATEGLAQDDNVRSHRLVVLDRQFVTGPTNARLDLVGNEQYVEPSAQRLYLFEVAGGWDNDPSFALYRLEHDRGNSLSLRKEKE